MKTIYGRGTGHLSRTLCFISSSPDTQGMTDENATEPFEKGLMGNIKSFLTGNKNESGDGSDTPGEEKHDTNDTPIEETQIKETPIKKTPIEETPFKVGEQDSEELTGANDVDDEVKPEKKEVNDSEVKEKNEVGAENNVNPNEVNEIEGASDGVVSTEGTPTDGAKPIGGEQKDAEQKDTLSKEPTWKDVYAPKAKAFLQATADSGVADAVNTHIMNARGLVNALLLNPHGISSASRVLGMAFANGEAISDAMGRTARRYSRVVGKDPEIVKNTAMYRLYKRSQKDDKTAIDDSFKVIDDALKQAGVSDYRQMDTNQLTDYMDIIRGQSEKLRDELRTGKNADGKALSGSDLKTLRLQSRFLNDHMNKLDKQYKTVAPLENRINAEDRRHQRELDRQARQQQKLQAQQLKQDEKDNLAQSWRDAKDKTTFGDVLDDVYGDKPMDLDANGLPVDIRGRKKAFNRIWDLDRTYRSVMDSNPVGSQEYNDAKTKLDRLGGFMQYAQDKGSDYIDWNAAKRGREDADRKRKEAEQSMGRMTDMGRRQYIENIFKGPIGVDVAGVPSNPYDRARLLSALTSRNGRQTAINMGMDEKAINRYISDLSVNDSDRAKNLAQLDRYFNDLRQAEIRRKGIRGYDPGFNAILTNMLNDSRFRNVSVDERGVPNGPNAVGNRGRIAKALMNGFYDYEPDIQSNILSYMGTISHDVNPAIDSRLRALRNDIAEFNWTLLEQSRFRDVIRNEPYFDEVNTVYKGKVPLFENIGMQGADGRPIYAPIKTSDLNSLINRLKTYSATLPDSQADRKQRYLDVARYFENVKKEQNNRVNKITGKYGEVFGEIAKVSPGFSNENRLKELIDNGNWGSVVAHNQTIKALTAYAAKLLTKDGRAPSRGTEKGDEYRFVSGLIRSINISDASDRLMSFMRKYSQSGLIPSDDLKKYGAEVSELQKNINSSFGLTDSKRKGQYDDDMLKKAEKAYFDRIKEIKKEIVIKANPPDPVKGRKGRKKKNDGGDGEGGGDAGAPPITLETFDEDEPRDEGKKVNKGDYAKEFNIDKIQAILNADPNKIQKMKEYYSKINNNDTANATELVKLLTDGKYDGVDNIKGVPIEDVNKDALATYADKVLKNVFAPRNRGNTLNQVMTYVKDNNKDDPDAIRSLDDLKALIRDGISNRYGIPEGMLSDDDVGKIISKVLSNLKDKMESGDELDTFETALNRLNPVKPKGRKKKEVQVPPSPDDVDEVDELSKSKGFGQIKGIPKDSRAVWKDDFNYARRLLASQFKSGFGEDTDLGKEVKGILDTPNDSLMNHPEVMGRFNALARILAMNLEDDDKKNNQQQYNYNKGYSFTNEDAMDEVQGLMDKIGIYEEDDKGNGKYSVPKLSLDTKKIEEQNRKAEEQKVLNKLNQTDGKSDDENEDGDDKVALESDIEDVIRDFNYKDIQNALSLAYNSKSPFTIAGDKKKVRNVLKSKDAFIAKLNKLKKAKYPAEYISESYDQHPNDKEFDTDDPDEEDRLNTVLDYIESDVKGKTHLYDDLARMIVSKEKFPINYNLYRVDNIMKWVDDEWDIEKEDREEWKKKFKDKLEEYTRSKWIDTNRRVPNPDWKDYSMDDAKMTIPKTKRVRKSEECVDELLSWAMARGEDEYTRLTAVLSEDSFKKGAMAHVRSLEDVYDVLDSTIGTDCAIEFGRLFID